MQRNVKTVTIFRKTSDEINHACRKYFHGQFLLYKAMSYRAPLPKPLSFYAFLLQDHIFELLNNTIKIAYVWNQGK